MVEAPLNTVTLRCEERDAPFEVHQNVEVERGSRARRRRMHDIMLEDQPNGAYVPATGDLALDPAVPDAKPPADELERLMELQSGERPACE